MPTPSPSAIDDTDYTSEFQQFLSSLAQDPGREQIISEIEGIFRSLGFWFMVTTPTSQFCKASMVTMPFAFGTHQ